MTRYFSGPKAIIWTAPSESEWRDEKPSVPTVYVIYALDREQAGFLAKHRS